MAALVVGGELDLVHGEEVDLALDGHGFHGAHPVASVRRNAFLLARHEGDLPTTDARSDAIVDFASEEAQRQPDHPARVVEHVLDGAVGLARVGGPEEGRDGRPIEHGISLFPKYPPGTPLRKPKTVAKSARLE